MRSVLKQAAAQGIRIVSNAGGVNPQGCAARCAGTGRRARRAAAHRGRRRRRRAARSLPRCARPARVDMSSGDAAARTTGDAPMPTSARCRSRAALDAGADIVITGRCVDSAVTLGVLMHEFGWAADDYDRLAARQPGRPHHRMRLPGHRRPVHRLGTRCPTGRTSAIPIVECREDGSFVVTKPPGTGGLVTPATRRRAAAVRDRRSGALTCCPT